MSKVYFICGRVGAGKTTYSRRLAEESNAVNFNIDDWMVTLFGADAPKPLNLEWALPRTKRCNEQIWKTALQLVSVGKSAILDLGFYRKEQRQEFRQLAKRAGVAFEFHLVEALADTRRLRVQERNLGSITKTVEVSNQMFNWAESWFEDFDSTELDGVITAKS
jgi:predicted kinase